MIKNNFTKENRLLSAADFQYLRRDNRQISTKNLKVYYKKSMNGSDQSRIGVSVSKKVGNAVVRNSVKRMLRELFRKSRLKTLGYDFFGCYFTEALCQFL